jgi:predicted O-methyltransferase YrrM
MMLKNLAYRILANTHRKRSVQRLRLLESKLPSPSARLAIPFSYQGFGYFKSIKPRQNAVEIQELYRVICALQARCILEIGTARGGTLYLWTQAAASDATIISIDLPMGRFGGSYAESRIPFYRAFSRPHQTMHLLREDSHAPKTLTQVQHLLARQPIDFAFIDGDHTYEGVKADFLSYGPLVRPGGLIAFHDILPRPDLPDIQVDKLWSELRKDYDTKEIIGPDESGRKIGIGLLRVATLQTARQSNTIPDK